MFLVIVTNWYRSSCWRVLNEFEYIEDAMTEKEEFERRWHPYATIEILTKIGEGHYRPVEIKINKEK